MCFRCRSGRVTLYKNGKVIKEARTQQQNGLGPVTFNDSVVVRTAFQDGDVIKLDQGEANGAAGIIVLHDIAFKCTPLATSIAAENPATTTAAAVLSSTPAVTAVSTAATTPTIDDAHNEGSGARLKPATTVSLAPTIGLAASTTAPLSQPTSTVGDAGSRSMPGVIDAKPEISVHLLPGTTTSSKDDQGSQEPAEQGRTRGRETGNGTATADGSGGGSEGIAVAVAVVVLLCIGVAAAATVVACRGKSIGGAGRREAAATAVNHMYAHGQGQPAAATGPPPRHTAATDDVQPYEVPNGIDGGALASEAGYVLDKDNAAVEEPEYAQPAEIAPGSGGDDIYAEHEQQQQDMDMDTGVDYDSVLTTRPGASSAADRQAMLGAGHDIYTEQQQDTGTGTGVEYGSVLTRKGSVYAGFDVTDNVGTSTA